MLDRDLLGRRMPPFLAPMVGHRLRRVNYGEPISLSGASLANPPKSWAFA
jgi:hypothetical protein